MTVDSIFADAKGRFFWKDDRTVFGKNEYWATLEELQAQSQRNEITGDCDDFAELCVRNLRANGFPARFVFCQVETGGYHCVAATGGMILDNRQNFPTPQSKLPYKWISISGFAAGDPWHEIV
jgi:predicted transglutaminase-like cysteine proteinase